MSANDTSVSAFGPPDSPIGGGPLSTDSHDRIELLAAGVGGRPPAPPLVGVAGIGGPESSTAGTGQPGPAGGTLVEVPPPSIDDKPHRKVCLVGYTTSREEAPYGNPEWELWGMNNLHKKPDVAEHLGEYSRWYDVHVEDPAELDHPDGQGPKQNGDRAHLAWLREPHPFPIFMLDPLEGATQVDGSPLPPLSERFGFPSAVAMPKAQILAQHLAYITNTVSWQIAHLLVETIGDESYYLTDLSLVGIDMATGSEYASQRPSVEWFLGLAHGLGVELHIPSSSDLLKTAFLYGSTSQYAGMSAKVKTRLRELHGQKDQIEQQVANLQSMHASICGAIDSMAYIEGVWLPPTASANARDGVVVPAGAVSPVAEMLAKGEHADRHNKE